MTISNGGVSWSEAFGRSRAVRVVFPVKPASVPAVRKIVADRPLPESGSSGMYSPIIRTWGFLDGGAHYIDSYGYGMTTLHTGWRIVGWQAMRALCPLLDVKPPRRLTGEPPLDPPDELVQRFATTVEGDSAEQAHADILAGISNGEDLRTQCYQLFGDAAMDPVRQPTDPAHGEWGRHGFTAGAAVLLSAHFDVERAVALLVEARPSMPRGISAMFDDIADRIDRRSYTESDARELLQSRGLQPSRTKTPT